LAYLAQKESNRKSADFGSQIEWISDQFPSSDWLIEIQQSPIDN